jgi:hypothetical protein
LTSSEISTAADDGEFPTKEDRIILEIDNFDFTTMHNILYYLYTGKVNMHHSANADGSFQHPSYTFTPPEGYPFAADPFELYLTANMFLLEELEQRTGRFLRLKCSSENIISRLGDARLAPFDELKEYYLTFLAQSEIFEVVRNQDAFKELIESADEESVGIGYRRGINSPTFYDIVIGKKGINPEVLASRLLFYLFDSLLEGIFNDFESFSIYFQRHLPNHLSLGIQSQGAIANLSLRGHPIP